MHPFLLPRLFHLVFAWYDYSGTTKLLDVRSTFLCVTIVALCCHLPGHAFICYTLRPYSQHRVVVRVADPDEKKRRTWLLPWHITTYDWSSLFNIRFHLLLLLLHLYHPRKINKVQDDEEDAWSSRKTRNLPRVSTLRLSLEKSVYVRSQNVNYMINLMSVCCTQYTSIHKTYIH